MRTVRQAARLLAAGTLAVLPGLACSDGGTEPDDPLTVAPASVVLVPGESHQFSVSGTRDGPVTWSSSRPDVATVVEVTGFVEAVAEGTTTIRAESGSRSGTATVEVVPPPLIGLGEPMVSFEVVAGAEDPDAQSVAVTNTGGKTLTGLSLGDAVDSQGASASWLSAELADTEAPTAIMVSVSAAGLDAGVHTATLPVIAPGVANSPQNLSIRLTVLAPASIVLSQESAQLGTRPDIDSEPVQIDVTNGGDVPLTGLVAEVAYTGGGSEGWLAATLSGTDAPTTLTLVGSGAGLEVGTYQAEVVVATQDVAAAAGRAARGGPARPSTAAGGGARVHVAPVTVSVELTVSPGPIIQLSPASVGFTAVEGGDAPDPAVVAIQNGGGGELTDLGVGPIVYQGTGGWLSAQLASTTAPTEVTLTADPDGLVEGTYTASVPVSSPVATEGPAAIEVTLVVEAGAVIALSTGSLTFAAARLGSNPNDQVVQITNAGGGTLDGLTATIGYINGAPGWLAVALDDDTAPAVLTVQPLTGSRPLGTYTADVIIASSRPGVPSVTVRVTFKIVPSFVADISPLFQTFYSGYTYTPCTNCHFSGGNSPRLDDAAAAYQALVGGGRVVPGDPDAGVLICKIKGLSGCGTAMPLPPAQIQLIEQWILGGALF